MEKVRCHCGKEIQKRSLDSHVKTQFHINYMKSLYIEPEEPEKAEESEEHKIKNVPLVWFDDNLKKDKPYEYAWKKKNNFLSKLLFKEMLFIINHKWKN